MKRLAIDVSTLPTTVFGHRAIVWWGNLGIIAIESTMFGLTIASYFYLRTRVVEWPPNLQPPSLVYGTINLVILLASLWPNQLAKHYAEKRRVGPMRLWLTIAWLFSVAFTVVRGFEFTALNCSWDTNAYGSIVWTLLGFHTIHLGTELVETAVLLVLVWFGPLQPKRLVDVSENGDYWYFVVIAWVPIYAVLYLVPRWL